MVSLLKTQDAGYLRKQLTAERKRYAALVEQIAPRVAGMRTEWLERKPDFVQTLRRADLLGEAEATSAPQAARKRVEGFGKQTVWVDDARECTSPYLPVKSAAKAREARAEAHATDAPTALEKTGERQLGVLLRELATRQRRLDALTGASNKLATVRALMNTRGGHATPTKQVRTLKDAVAHDSARITRNGLVVDTDKDDERSATQTKKQYKWSNERKK